MLEKYALGCDISHWQGSVSQPPVIHRAGAAVGRLGIGIGKSQVVLYHTQCGMPENALKRKYVPAVSQILDCKSVPKPMRVDIGHTGAVSQSEQKMTERIAARRHRGSARRRKAAAQVARLHERIANRRRDFWHKLTRQLADTYRKSARGLPASAGRVVTITKLVVIVSSILEKVLDILYDLYIMVNKFTTMETEVACQLYTLIRMMKKQRPCSINWLKTICGQQAQK